MIYRHSLVGCYCYFVHFLFFFVCKKNFSVSLIESMVWGKAYENTQYVQKITETDRKSTKVTKSEE